MLVAMRKYLFYSIIGLFGLGIFLIGFSVDALTVSPTIYELTASQGQTIVKAVRLENESKDVQTFQPSTQNFIADPEGKSPYFVGNEPQESLANWISINSSKITLKPGEKVDVPFTIMIPNNAEPGGHYAAIGWSDIPSSVSSGANISVNSDIRFPMILLNVVSDANGQPLEVVEDAKIQSFGTKDGETMFQRLPVVFTASISNSGNVHFRPEGHITVKNMFGRAVAVLPFNPGKGEGNVLPNSVREFFVPWDKGLAFGMYTGELTMMYGRNGKTLDSSSTVTFWVMPPVMVLLWLVAIILIIAIGVLLTARGLKRSPEVNKNIKS